MAEIEFGLEGKTNRVCADDSSRALLLDSCLRLPEKAAAIFSLTGNESKEVGSAQTIDIKDAAGVFGWWQQEQYEKIGVEKIRIAPGSAGLDLKAPYHKGSIVADLDIDGKFSFEFRKDDKGNWTLSKIKGLKVDGVSYEHASASENGIKFWNDRKQEKEFGKRASGFIKALLEPLMRDDLRK